MSLKIDIEKIADIGKIDLTEKEKKMFRDDLKNILKAFENISEVNTDKIKPTFQPVEVKNIVREDIIEKSLDRETALANTKNKEGSYFTGPKAI